MKVEIRRVFNENFQVLPRAESLATVATGGLRHRPLHRHSAYEGKGAAGHYSRQTDPHDDQPSAKCRIQRSQLELGLTSSSCGLV